MLKKHPLILSSLLSAAFMFLIPFGLSALPGDFMFGFAFLFLYVMAPVWSALAGAWAGTDVRQMWPLPLITAGFALLGSWTSFSWGNPDFLLFMAAYAAIGLLAMWLTYTRIRRKLAEVLAEAHGTTTDAPSKP